MLSMRLMPVGKKHQRSFRVVVDQKRHKLTGKNVEDLGWYNPHTNAFEFNNERINYWLKNGAQPTDTTHNLLIKTGVIKGKKIAVHSASKKKAEPESADAPPAQAEEAKEAPVAEVKEETATETKEAPTPLKEEVGAPTAERVGEESTPDKEKEASN